MRGKGEEKEGASSSRRQSSRVVEGGLVDELHASGVLDRSRRNPSTLPSPHLPRPAGSARTRVASSSRGACSGYASTRRPAGGRARFHSTPPFPLAVEVSCRCLLLLLSAGSHADRRRSMRCGWSSLFDGAGMATAEVATLHLFDELLQWV